MAAQPSVVAGNVNNLSWMWSARRVANTTDNRAGAESATPTTASPRIFLSYTAVPTPEGVIGRTGLFPKPRLVGPADLGRPDETIRSLPLERSRSQIFSPGGGNRRALTFQLLSGELSRRRRRRPRPTCLVRGKLKANRSFAEPPPPPPPPPLPPPFTIRGVRVGSATPSSQTFLSMSMSNSMEIQSYELNYDGRKLMIRHWKKCYSVNFCPQWKVSAKLQIEVGVSIDRWEALEFIDAAYILYLATFLKI
ncbi:hypothetical protein NL676_033960 [Syzygium grande]|nr:hypothetical protein NL676_033960 [Syzygium grande]